MMKRQPWLEKHYASTGAAGAERPSDIKYYFAQRSLFYINVPVPIIKFRNEQFELFDRVKLLRRTIAGHRRTVLQVRRLDGLPTALHWVVPFPEHAPSWKHEMHTALQQPTQQDDNNDVFPGARLDVSQLLNHSVDPELCKEILQGELYQFDTLPASFARNNYGS